MFMVNEDVGARRKLMALVVRKNFVEDHKGIPVLTIKMGSVVRWLVIVATLTCAWGAQAGPAPWVVSINDRDGLPAITLGGAKIVSSQYVFWGKDWTWANLATQFKVFAPYKYTVSGKNEVLKFNLSGRVTKPTDHQLVLDFDLDASTATPDAIGGGMSFKLDFANFAQQLGDPELLPDNRGWTWGQPGGTRIEMRFDPPLASVFFEKGNKADIRAFFYKDGVPQGRQHFVATMAVSDNMTMRPTAAERFGLESDAAWAKDILDWATSPVDLSFLNAPERPAGKHGFLTAVKDRLVFDDGTSGRFWGTNVTAASLFKTPRDDVKRQARRLSELGFNLVRIHHHDSHWVRFNIFGDRSPDTQNLNAAALENLDWWIKCLKDEGIYVWLDLHVGRRLTATDGVQDFSEMTKGKPNADFRGFNYVNPSVQLAMERFNASYVNHQNRFTGLKYKDDPAIIAILLTNENDLTNHFAGRLLPTAKVPQHTALYMAQAKAFAEKNRIPSDKVWQSWLPGVPKMFLNELEHKFNARMIEQLRKMSVKAPIATTNTWGGNPLSSLPSLTDGDVIDVHSYGAAGALETNPVHAANWIDWIAAAQIAGRPLSVTEWNVSKFPVPDRHTAPLHVAAAASLQGWDALMQFAYSTQPLDRRRRAGPWDAFNDPALVATLPAAALLFRRQDVQEARNVYVFAPTSEQLFGQKITPDNSPALRTAAEKGKLMVALPEVNELPWLKKSEIPANAKVITDPQQTLIDPNASESVSDNGEVKRNWEEGVYSIDTPRTQAASGWIGGKKMRLKDVEFDITTRNATVAVQSLDDKPIAASSKLMISLGARSNPDATNTSFYSEPVTGQLIIHAPKGRKLYRRNGTNQESEIPVSYENDRYHIKLDRDLASYWLVLR
jgi:hypothetical protein